MTVPENSPIITYSGNNSNTRFDFNFLVNKESELVVQLTKSDNSIKTLILNVDYSINEIGLKDGSFITFPLENSNYGILGFDEKITLGLNLPIKQEVPYANSGGLVLRVLENSFDYLTRLIQIIKQKVDRSMKIPDSADEINLLLPLPEPNKVFKWNNDATALENFDLIAENETFKSQMINDANATKQELLGIQSDFEDEVNTKILQVSDAADKINQLEDAVTDAKTSADKALNYLNQTSGILSETNKVHNEVVTTVEQVKNTINNINFLNVDYVKETETLIFSNENHFKEDETCEHLQHLMFEEIEE